MAVPKQYLGAFKRGHRESAKEFIDEDFSIILLDRIVRSEYQDTKALEALAFLSKFNNEYHKNVIKKDDPTSLHNTERLRKDLYSRENARNRDIMSVRCFDMEPLHDLVEIAAVPDFLDDLIENLEPTKPVG
jgi:hypothetical protein